MNSPRPDRTGSRGFSLIELLAAMAVVVVITLLAAQVINQVSLSWAGGKQLADNLNKGRAAMDLIGRDLGTGVFRPDLGAFKDDTGGVSSATGNYCFFAARGGAPARSISLINYRVEPDTTLSRQVLTVPWTDGPDPGISFGKAEIPQMAWMNSKGTTSKLLSGVLALRMYFIHANADGSNRTVNLDYVNAAGQRARAIGIAMVVMDETTQRLVEAQGKLASLQNAGWNPPADLSHGLGGVWKQTLNNFWQGSASAGFPVSARSGIRVFETMVFLSDSSQ